MPFEVAHLVDLLPAIALPVADVEQPVVAHGNAMHDLRECASDAAFGFFLCRLMPPLAQELTLAIEYCYAAVTVPVGDVDVTTGRIDDDSRGIEELCRARVQVLALAGAVGAVEETALADL